MSDKSQKRWIFGLNFFRDYFVKFDVPAQQVSLWNVKGTRNHSSLAVTKNNPKLLIDNTQDADMNKKKAECSNNGIYV